MRHFRKIFMVRPLVLMVLVAKTAYWTSGSVGKSDLDRTTGVGHPFSNIPSIGHHLVKLD